MQFIWAFTLITALRSPRGRSLPFTLEDTEFREVEGPTQGHTAVWGGRVWTEKLALEFLLDSAGRGSAHVCASVPTLRAHPCPQLGVGGEWTVPCAPLQVRMCETLLAVSSEPSACANVAWARTHARTHSAACSDVLAVGLTTETQLHSGRETSAVET